MSFGFVLCGVLAAAGFLFYQRQSAIRLEVPKQTRQRHGWLSVAGAALWLTVTAAVAGAGLFSRFDARPPPFAGLFVSVLAVSFGLAFSGVGRRWLMGLTVAELIGAQAVRLPLELVMHQAATEGVMPPQMTFSGEGLNFDIVSGALALPVALLIAKGIAPRILAWAWLGLAWTTLIAVLAIALASTPIIHAFGTDATHLNTFVAYFPFVWLPAGPVVLALAGQLVLTCQLLKTRG